MLSEFLANPEAFRWIAQTGLWHVFWGLLVDLSPEVLAAKEVGQIDTGMNDVGLL
jgi:hypothetical protein